MPNNCAVRWCQNTKRKTKDTGIRFFRFPREKYLKDEWLRRCGRGDDLNADNAVVCSVHFLTADYDIPLKYRLMGYKTPKNLRTLKEDAVPSINLSEDEKDESAADDLDKRNIEDFYSERPVTPIQDVPFPSPAAGNESDADAESATSDSYETNTEQSENAIIKEEPEAVPSPSSPHEVYIKQEVMPSLDAFHCANKPSCDPECDTRTFKCNQDDVDTDTSTCDFTDNKPNLIVPDTNGELFKWLLQKIHHLEQENKRLQAENVVLKAKLFDKAIDKSKIFAEIEKIFKP